MDDVNRMSIPCNCPNYISLHHIFNLKIISSYHLDIILSFFLNLYYFLFKCYYYYYLSFSFPHNNYTLFPMQLLLYLNIFPSKMIPSLKKCFTFVEITINFVLMTTKIIIIIII
jgi:hypothetical protein